MTQVTSKPTIDESGYGYRMVGSTWAWAILLALGGILAWGNHAWAWSSDAKEDVAVEDVEEIDEEVTQGALRVVDKEGVVVECPLKHTDVDAMVSGFLSRVTVTQTFENPASDNIEAVYVFPLPHSAAVDQMTMIVGDRRIEGLIKRRADARAIYQQAIDSGQTAALLEQERPNIFTQTVGNIEPGQEIKVEISYVDVLEYDMGSYQFHFPMVVGPRYTPSGGVGAGVPAGIDSPALKPEERNGHDISLTVSLDAGVPIQNLQSTNHRCEIKRDGERRATISIAADDSLPNKDFVLNYDVAGERPELAVLAHTGAYSRDAQRYGEGYFMLMIQPQEDERLTKSPPREVVFLIDVSGSMSGEPTAKVKESMQHMLKLCRATDTVQVVTFASSAYQLFDKPVPVNDDNISKAIDFSRSRKGGGGTEMLRGVRMAMDQPKDPERMRIIVMLTDGYIGNEAEIIEHVGKTCGDDMRFWTIGIGQSPNMFLIDGVARQGGGMGKRLGLNDAAEPMCLEIMTRVQRAQLAKISIDWAGLQTSQTFPTRIPELWAGRPVILYGRYKDGGSAEIKINGTIEGEAVSWPIKVTLPKAGDEHQVLAPTWARQKIEDLMQQAYYADSPAVEEEVTSLALDYRLMSQYTSFVAIDPSRMPEVVSATPPRRMLVPLPIPEGTEWSGFFGGEAGLEEERLSQLSDGGISLGWFSSNREFDFQSPVVGDFAGGGYSRGFGLNPSRSKSLARYEQLQGVEGKTSFGRSSLAPVRLSLAKNLSTSRGGYPVAGVQVTPMNGWAFQNRRGVERRLSRLAAPAPVNFAISDLFSADDGLRIDGFSSLQQRLGAEHPKVKRLVADANEAMKMVETANKLAEEGKLTEARSLLARAYFIDMASAYFQCSQGMAASAALVGIENVDAARVAKWSEEQPLLNESLGLLIRDESLKEALDRVASEAGLDIRVVDGSITDVMTMRREDELAVTYLDLRGAKVHEALDWLAKMSGLNWTLDGDEVVIHSSRREAGETAWVYDLSTIAYPTKAELTGIDSENILETVTRLSDEMIETIRTHVAPDGDQRVQWFTPLSILVIGDVELHESVRATLDKLHAETMEGNEDLRALHTLTSKRSSSRKKADGLIARYRKINRALQVLDNYSMDLVASAAGGELHLEALTELRRAWSNPELQAYANETLNPTLIHAGWAVQQSTHGIVNTELQQLSAVVRPMLEKQMDLAVDNLQKNPTEKETAVALLFGQLVGDRHDARYQSISEMILNSAEGDTTDRRLNVLAESLLLPVTDERRNALLELVQAGVSGDAEVLLLALAARRHGDAAWDTFRRESRFLLGGQSLRGATVIFANRLAEQRFDLAQQ